MGLDEGTKSTSKGVLYKKMILGRNVLFKGAGDFASGAIRRLNLAGAKVVATELEKPLNVRREVSFSEAVYRGSITVDGVKAILTDESGIDTVIDNSHVAVLIDPACGILKRSKFDILVDAIMAKRNTGTKITDAPIVIALGPGFIAGKDCHAVVETLAGHNLGRVIYKSAAANDTGQPATPEMYLGPCNISKVIPSDGLILRAPSNGVFIGKRQIGEIVQKGDLIGIVAGIEVKAGITGVLRGLIHNDVTVTKKMKIGDIDPSCETQRAFTISEKSNAIAGGVLEACLTLLRKRSTVT